MDQTSNQRTDSPDPQPIKVCPICGNPRLRQIFKVDHAREDSLHDCGKELGFTTATVVLCRDCSFRFKAQQPPSSYLNQHYANSGEEYLASLAEDNTMVREDFRVARQLLNVAFPGGGTILDVGC